MKITEPRKNHENDMKNHTTVRTHQEGGKVPCFPGPQPDRLGPPIRPRDREPYREHRGECRQQDALLREPQRHFWWGYTSTRQHKASFTLCRKHRTHKKIECFSMFLSGASRRAASRSRMLLKRLPPPKENSYQGGRETQSKTRTTRNNSRAREREREREREKKREREGERERMNECMHA